MRIAEVKIKKATVIIKPHECPTGNVDCWDCPCFGGVDPDNVGESVVVCRYSEENKEES